MKIRQNFHLKKKKDRERQHFSKKIHSKLFKYILFSLKFIWRFYFLFCKRMKKNCFEIIVYEMLMLKDIEI